MLSSQSRRGQINNLFYQRNDHSTNFFFSSSKNCRKYFFWIFDDFFTEKIAFQPPDQGWRNRGPRRNFCGEIQWFFDILSFAQFFFKYGPQTEPGWPPLLHTDFQRFFIFVFLSSRFWPLNEKKTKIKIWKNHFLDFRPPNFPLWVWMYRGVKDPRLVFRRSLWNLDCDGNQRWVFFKPSPPQSQKTGI